MIETGFQPDLVILDMNMPGMDGAAALPRIRALCPNVPVLLATGRADQKAIDLVETHARVTLLKFCRPKPRLALAFLHAVPQCFRPGRLHRLARSSAGRVRRACALSALPAANLAWWNTGTQYLFIAAFGMMLHGLFERTPLTVFCPSTVLVLGIVLFSGSLFAMTLGAPRWLGMITPLGGISLVAGFLWMGLRAL
jgi:uncharacterized membrane protein YgdD (TMEM256/DUF423 family)